MYWGERSWHLALITFLIIQHTQGIYVTLHHGLGIHTIYSYALHFCEQKNFVLSFIIGHGHLNTNNLLLVAEGSENLLIEVGGSG